MDKTTSLIVPAQEVGTPRHIYKAMAAPSLPTCVVGFLSFFFAQILSFLSVSQTRECSLAPDLG